MEATVDKLEAMFHQAECDIDYISRKLDLEFSNDQVENEALQNPKKMLEKISEIKSEFSDIVKEAEAIKMAQIEAVDFFKTQLTTACAALQKLQDSANMESTEKPEELKQVEEILGIEVQPEQNDQDEGTHLSTTSTTPSGQNELNSHIKSGNNLPNSDVSETAHTHVLTPYERRVGSSELIEIDEDEFKSVSTLVRGRAKLSEVNTVYRLLWTHFKENDNDGPLSSTDMYKMGLRVTGQTGEAKLKVLRSLKLLHIHKNGSVELL